MSKRGFGSAFACSSPGALLVNVRSDFDASQPQAQSYSPAAPSLSPISSLRIPGQWPLAELARDTAAIEHYDDDSPSTRTSSFITTVGKWATTVAFDLILGAPARLTQRFFRRQQIIVEPYVREDGAHKKRILDAGPADEPTTPCPKHKTRMALARRLYRPYVTKFSPIKQQRLPTPSPPQPYQVVQPLYVHNNVSNDVSFEDAPGAEDLPMGEAQQAEGVLFREDAFMKEEHGSDVANVPIEEDVSMDDSLDFSFDDVLTGTPPLNHITGSPMPLSYHTVSVPETVGNSPTPIVPRPSQFSIQASVNKFSQLSPGTNKRIIDLAPVTPIRKQLLAYQVKSHRGLAAPSTPPTDHTNPNLLAPTNQQSELKQQAVQASVLKINAPTIAHDAFEANLAYAKAQEQRAAELRLAELAQWKEQNNFCETVNEELSFLSDASDDNIDATPKPSLRGKKRVTWTEHAATRAFFLDSRVVEMQDSILEAITFSPVRRHEVDETEDDSSDVDGPEMSTLSDSTDDVSSGGEAEALVPSVGFTGVPPETWEDSDDSFDDSLEESQISIELLEDLREDLRKKLDLAPPAPPPVPALVTPITPEERAKIDAAATKSENGKDLTADIVKGKLNARDFSTLLPAQFNGDPRAWLNDSIVNEYLSILVAQKKKDAGFVPRRGGPAPPVHAFSSFWYNTLKDRPDNVVRWSARFQLASKQYLDADLVLYPICDKNHWRLLAVKPKERTIEYFDSLGGTGTVYINKFKGYLAQELQEYYVEDEWNVVKGQRSKQQINGSDCGVFTLLNALALLRGEDVDRVLPCDGMPDARDRIAVTLMAGKPTTELV